MICLISFQQRDLIKDPLIFPLEVICDITNILLLPLNCLKTYDIKGFRSLRFKFFYKMDIMLNDKNKYNYTETLRYIIIK